ncbi:U4/U6-U5 snRNP complex subunit prp31 [Allomyces arbusculus]|nr:U4/U6-U5 snRNP complex subunit prp31 [Allomyces arbusculus]
MRLTTDRFIVPRPPIKSPERKTTTLYSSAKHPRNSLQTMATHISDSLLADLDDLDDLGPGLSEENDDQTPAESNASAPSPAGPSSANTGDDDDADMADGDLDAEDAAAAADYAARIAALVRDARGDLQSAARVYYSRQFQDLLKRVEALQSAAADSSSAVAGTPDVDDAEYQTVVAANNLIPDLDHDLAILHKYVIDHWGPRFPELSSLIRAPLDYIRTVQALGHDLDDESVSHEKLCEHLPQAVALSVTLALSTSNKQGNAEPGTYRLTSRGRTLTPEAMAKTDEACRVAIALDQARATLLQYIESRMHVLAPNVSALVGTAVAARLMGAAGGLAALCRIPACNLLVLGQAARVAAVSSSREGGVVGAAVAGAPQGFSNLGLGRHRGFVWDADLVRLTPSEFRRKAARMVAAKVCLCARMDLAKAHRDASYGQKVRADLDRHLEKAMAPPPLKSTKALPIPDEAPKKRRGGRRARKIKEQYTVTDVHKAANRVAFGHAEEEIIVYGETRGLGLLSSSAQATVAGTTAMRGTSTVMTGKVRGPAVDAKTRAKMSDKLKAKLKAIGGYTSTTPGAATALLAPTPVAGTATSTLALAAGVASVRPGATSSAAAPTAAAGTATSAVSGLSTSLSFTPVQGLEFADPLAQQKKVLAANERWFGKGMGFVHVGKDKSAGGGTGKPNGSS